MAWKPNKTFWGTVLAAAALILKEIPTVPEVVIAIIGAVGGVIGVQGVRGWFSKPSA